MPNKYRTAQLFLFDTCTHKCAYCHFAESGKVLDGSQLRPYRDPAFIDQIARFFLNRTSEQEKWLLHLTGGEPLLMPNLPEFARKVCKPGNKIALNTAMLIGDKHPSVRFLIEEGAPMIDYLFVSFHPEAEEIEDLFFRRIERLKRSGHGVILNFICHPARLHRVDELARRCADLDIAFYPGPLYSPEFPGKYTAEQRAVVLRHASSRTQIIWLESGLDTRSTRCWAGSRLISIDMRTGNIAPCASTPRGPSLGNIYEDRFAPFDSAISCPAAGIGCACEAHFHNDIVIDAEDSDNFARAKNGYVEPIDVEAARASLEKAGLSFSTAKPRIGQTSTADFLALSTEHVKAVYERNRNFFTGEYYERNHPSFRNRQR